MLNYRILHQMNQPLLRPNLTVRSLSNTIIR